MALGQSAVSHRGLDTRGEVEQAEGVGHRRACSADACRESVLREPELIDQLAVGVGRFDRVEVLALKVLDEGELELVAVRELADQGGDAVEAGGLGGSKAAFPSHELVAVDRLRHQDRLEDAVLSDACRQRGEALLVEPLARLMRVWLDAVRRDLERAGLTGAALRDQGCKAATEPLGTLRPDRHDATASGDCDRSGSSRLSRARSSFVNAA
jgi:hypothetical protein